MRWGRGDEGGTGRGIESEKGRVDECERASVRGGERGQGGVGPMLKIVRGGGGGGVEDRACEVPRDERASSASVRGRGEEVRWRSCEWARR